MGSEPFPIDEFQVYFQRTYFSLCQILGEDARDKIQIAMMCMAMRI